VYQTEFGEIHFSAVRVRHGAEEAQREQREGAWGEKGQVLLALEDKCHRGLRAERSGAGTCRIGSNGIGEDRGAKGDWRTVVGLVESPVGVRDGHGHANGGMEGANKHRGGAAVIGGERKLSFVQLDELKWPKRHAEELGDSRLVGRRTQ
jgi:hypothetical protein